MNNSTQQFEQTLKALQYIEDHLTDPICIEDISRHVNYSLFHFSRVFNAVCMISPYAYLMRRRISEAAKQVVETRRRLTDIALDYGFQSSEVFSRSFRRLFSATPSELRKKKYIDSRFLLPAVTEIQLEKWQQYRNIQVQKDEWPFCHACGILDRNDGSSQALTTAWEELSQQVALHQPLSILYFPHQWETLGQYVFTGLCEPIEPASRPHWFVEKQIPAQFAVSTRSEVPIQEIQTYLAYLSAVWFPISSFQSIYPFVICLFQNSLTSATLYIPVIHKENHDVL